MVAGKNPQEKAEQRSAENASILLIKKRRKTKNKWK